MAQSPLGSFLDHCRSEGLDDVEGCIAWHIRNAHVYSGPECFAMAIPANSGELLDGWLPPSQVRGVVDCWCVTGVSSNLRAALLHLPYPLPWIAFYRIKRGQNRFAMYPASRLKALCHVTT
jgi:hypothetical protein